MNHRWLAAIPVAAAFLAPVTTAQSVDQLLPPDTLFVASIDDMATYAKSLDAMPLTRIMNEEEVVAFLEKPQAMIREGLASLQEQIRSQEGFESFELSLDDLGKGSYGRLFVALTHIAMPDPQAGREEPDIGLVFGCEAKAGAPDWQAIVKDLLARMAGRAGHSVAFQAVTHNGHQYEELSGDDSQRPPILMGKAGDLLLFSLSHQSMQEVLGRAMGAAAPTLRESSHYQASQKALGVGGSGVVRVYVGVDLALRVASEALKMAMVADGRDEMLPLVDRILDMSGLLGLKSLALAENAVEGVSIGRSFVGIEGEPTGLLALSPGKAIGVEHLAMVPKTAASLSIKQLDIAALYDLAMNMLKEIDANSYEEAKGAAAGLGEMLGGADNPTDLRNDLLANIGPEFMFLQVQSTSLMMPAWLLLAEVREADKVMNTLKAGLELVGSQTGGSVSLKSTLYREAEIIEVAIAEIAQMGVPVTPCFVIYKGYLVVALNSGDLKRHIRFLEKGGSDIRENEDFQRFYAKIPEGAHLTSLSYTDLRGAVESGYGQVVTFLPMAGAMIGTELPIEVALMPRSETITNHLYGSLSYGMKTNDGAISESFGPIGGEVVGVILGAGVLAGLVVWSANVREVSGSAAAPPAPIEMTPMDQARRDLNNLKSGLAIYKLQHGQLPERLEDLLTPTESMANGLLGTAELPVDPWGHGYQYLRADTAYKVWSIGPNGIDEAGVGDDILVSRN